MTQHIYYINIRTLQVKKDDGKHLLKPYEWAKVANDYNHFITLFVNYIIDKGLAHKTFNTTAKKDIIQFIKNKNNNPKIGAAGEFGQLTHSEK